jgi:S1-C subfamily serine protease
MVMKVVPEGPASKAGVRALSKNSFGDVIVGINYKRVSSSDDIVKMLDELAPGRRVTVQLKRASQNLDSDKYDFVDLSVVLASAGELHYPMIAV